MFPTTRLRRLRRTEALRSLVRETHVTAHDLILPIFIEEGIDAPVPINSMPGVSRIPERHLAREIEAIARDGVRAVMLFGISHAKDATGADTLRPDGLLARMARTVKDAAPELVVMTDNCFCEYTDHGHCGVVGPDGAVVNDATLENLARQAVIAADAGADVIAPSAMMDGQIGAIRRALDGAGHDGVPVLAYSTKFASAFYGPFRDAVGSAATLGKSNKKVYQMDSGNSDEALREVALDIAEGADMVMVKPGMPYLDIVRRVRDTFNVPTFAYQVSGEYAMIMAAAQNGWLDGEKTMMEVLTSIKRAGADAILTYFAKEAAAVLRRG